MSAWRRATRRVTKPGVSAAATATNIATGPPTSMSALKTTTKAGGMIARLAVAES